MSALTDIGIAQNESYVSWTTGIFTDLHVQLFIDISADQILQLLEINAVSFGIIQYILQIYMYNY